MKPELILEALSKLDPENNDHWTQDGSPRLGAVGEGVTRQSILDVAPLFNRKNAVEALTQAGQALDTQAQEIESEQAQKADEVRNAKAEAEAKIRAAITAMQVAKAELEAANLEYNEVTEAEKALDTRSDVEINMEFLQKDLELRLEKAEQRQQALKLLQVAGVSGKDIRLYSLGVADRAIAEANIRKRKEAAQKR